jgi:hypothetical protein
VAVAVAVDDWQCGRDVVGCGGVIGGRMDGIGWILMELWEKIEIFVAVAVDVAKVAVGVAVAVAVW